uniref:Cucumopine synthase n=1 Tax=Rhizobium rhizogenes TaxID=359 RepID=Q9R718_RHIRH|nr:cucumopine synthase [Rhizobium rhizogenes]
MLRDQSMYTWYPLLLTFQDERFTLEQCCALVHRFDYAYSNYLRYSGLQEMGAFAEAITKYLPTAGSRDEAVEAVKAFLGYLNRLAAWSFHYFPWSIGKHLTYETPEVPSRPWPIPLGVFRSATVKRYGLPGSRWASASLPISRRTENPELCNDLIQALPFTVVQDHAVVSGESMYAWAPVVSTAKVNVKERQCDAPVGRIRYSQGTGNKVIVQYGEVTEDIATPVLGEILPEYADDIYKVGRAVLEATFLTKELFFLKMEPTS